MGKTMAELFSGTRLANYEEHALYGLVQLMQLRDKRYHWPITLFLQEYAKYGMDADKVREILAYTEQEPSMTINTYTVSILANGRTYEYTVEHDSIEGALEFAGRAHSMLIRGDSEVVSVAKGSGARSAEALAHPKISDGEIRDKWNFFSLRDSSSYSQDAVDLVRWALARYGVQQASPVTNEPGEPGDDGLPS